MKTVLLVDDDPILQVALSRRLQAQDYQVLQATSALAALDLFATQTVDVVVSDIMMPGMDGLEFCQRLRSTTAGQMVPFIFLSSLGEVNDRVQGHRIGADDYLAKPFHAKELIAKVQGAIARSERLRGVFSQQALPPSSESSSSDPPGSADQAVPRSLPLTPAETKVFWEVVQGFTNKQIGDHLFISPRTVQTHLSNMLTKLKLDNRSQLVRFAFEQGHRPPSPSLSLIASPPKAGCDASVKPPPSYG
ncbi:response regulator transcription factor [Phormidium sp. FACHB-1136]|uniref:response regulator transcription factor n=1 Tax=Phormidium sp. FACHB-1136 TaxID=2692848 RepID=UPI00168903E0|nr:response regulator transcription factor [Phormidium sp. FACHB-1136]MBD2426394.1 response regulator transcription factor [Phormidium sp. FACHB-1136]